MGTSSGGTASAELEEGPCAGEREVEAEQKSAQEL